MTTPANTEVDLTVRQGGCGRICESILQELPAWFGIEEANADYALAAEQHTTVVASLMGREIGLTTLIQHSDEAAEVHLMAVSPDAHRQGVGAAMLARSEEHLVARGVQFLQVKTLADEHPDVGYAKTRSFYRAVGFATLEVFGALWGSDNPALQMIKHLPTHPAQNDDTNPQPGRT